MRTAKLTSTFVAWIEDYTQRRNQGILHITFEDGNLTAGNIVWEMREAWNSGNFEGAEICRRLLLLDDAELLKLGNKWWDDTLWNLDDYPEPAEGED